ncbi:hypothetical protein FAES_1106 [Fibrella aestuarina BUZ 2]|uniref:DUF3575 domain-containing protein n=1 Tax=Fibrella aestuarina BUZ 2 TaxID=1166018 RepID=I0K4R3_9BACT|nr:hypothetical protein [Fibrella aestuarina]CCG99116.1 hypothetical protein FAES_1106 [Fibrella aestuarina BUZ 2]
MKQRALVVLGTLLLTLSAQAQDTIPLYSTALAQQKAQLAQSRRPWIGTDLSRGIWWAYAALNSAQTPIYYKPISLIVYWPVRPRQLEDRNAYASIGYATYAGTLRRTVYQRGQSAHVRAGIEIRRKKLLLGYGALLANWSGEGSILFKGPALGDYLQPTGPLNGLALGVEAHLGSEIDLGPRLALRCFLRTTLLAKTRNALAIEPPHLSGIDWLKIAQTGGIGLSGNINLVYQL